VSDVGETYGGINLFSENPRFVSFLVGQPAFQIIMTCLAIGADPHDIFLGVVNHEIGECETAEKDVGCMMSSLKKYNSRASCEFIRSVKKQVFGLVITRHL